MATARDLLETIGEWSLAVAVCAVPVWLVLALWDAPHPWAVFVGRTIVTGFAIAVACAWAATGRFWR